MGLVHDNGVVFEQVGIGLGLGEQHAVGHDLDAGLGCSLVAEADFAADIAAVGYAQFLRNAAGDGERGDATRLGDGDAAGLASAGL